MTDFVLGLCRSSRVVKIYRGFIPWFYNSLQETFFESLPRGHGYKRNSGMPELDKSISVLVVDDFSSMREIIRNILRQLGIRNIDVAEDGSSAVPKLSKKSYDVALVDFNMPRMNGVELIKHIRSNEKTKSMPIIMITAEAKKENIVSAVDAGVSDYIVKPFTAGILEDKLLRVLPK